MQWALIALGGALGSLLRAGIKQWLLPTQDRLFLSGNATLLANLVGCFLIGLIFQWTVEKNLSLSIQAFLITGLLGGLTTYSSFIMDLMLMPQKKDWALSGLYLGLSITGGVLLFILGRNLIRDLMLS
ncbi:MAG: CrcB family protein [Bdellovibrionales bacterium]|nr:CrcB family protein [Bdellovibrionales bacterium]